ncbi:MAG: hypothetical protein AB1758_02550 [Candidatus Eremiobacterota bacterium]
MTTLSGVSFHSRPDGWRAVLPSGSYLPEAVVLERHGDALTAHLEEPLQERFTFPCSQDPDGTVRVRMREDRRAEVVFRPDTLEWGVQSGWGGNHFHRESYHADGSWTFSLRDTDRLYEATRDPGGTLTGRLVRGGRELPMEARLEGGSLHIGPAPRWRERIREQGMVAGLWTALRCFCSPSLTTFLYRDRWQLFPELGRKADAARREFREIVTSAHRMVAPETSAQSVLLTEDTVAVGGVVVRKRQGGC